MPDKGRVIELVRSAFASEPRLKIHDYPIAIAFEDEDLLLDGEVPSVAAKKLALERAGALPGVTGIVDRLRVEPPQRMGDGEILDLLVKALMQEPAFEEYGIRKQAAGRAEVIRDTPVDWRGTFELAVDDGVVTLNGVVQGLDDKRLAGVLAWWIPGTRDVVNGIGVEPDEEDSFDMIAEAVRLVLEKDPWVDAAQIRVGVRGRSVTLGGVLSSESQRAMAEKDAWYVFGVDSVVNKIELRR